MKNIKADLFDIKRDLRCRMNHDVFSQGIIRRMVPECPKYPAAQENVLVSEG